MPAYLQVIHKNMASYPHLGVTWKGGRVHCEVERCMGAARREVAQGLQSKRIARGLYCQWRAQGTCGLVGSLAAP